MIEDINVSYFIAERTISTFYHYDWFFEMYFSHYIIILSLVAMTSFAFIRFLKMTANSQLLTTTSKTKTKAK